MEFCGHRFQKYADSSQKLPPIRKIFVPISRSHLAPWNTTAASSTKRRQYC